MSTQAERDPESQTADTATTELSPEQRTKLEEYSSHFHMFLTFQGSQDPPGRLDRYPPLSAGQY